MSDQTTQSDLDLCRRTMRMIAESYDIPRHMIEGLVEYIVIGQPVGTFLENVLSNDFVGAFRHADPMNRQMLAAYPAFLLHHAPVACYGSPGAYAAWVSRMGLTPVFASQTSAPESSGT